MPASGIKLADANIWLALAYSGHVHHPVAQTWFDTQSNNSCAFCRITQLALLRHLTNSKIMGPFVQNQQQAWAAYDSLSSDPRVTFLQEPATLDAEFRRLTQSSAPSHQQWTDAYLASIAKLSSAQLVSFDRGFGSFAGLDFVILG